MQRFKFLTGSAVVFMFPVAFVSAQNGLAVDGTGGAFGTLLITLVEFSNTILIPFVIGIGFLFFVWGMFQYFIAGGANDEAKEKGKSLMIYATLGFILILVFWGIINILASSTGLEKNNIIYSPTSGITL